MVGAGSINHTCGRGPWYSVLLQKYVLLTIISGALSVILGSLFITIYFVVRNTTTSLHYFETLPTYIPGVTVRSRMDVFGTSMVMNIIKKAILSQ